MFSKLPRYRSYFGTCDPRDIRNNSSYHSSDSYHELAEQYCDLLSEIRSLQVSLDIYRRSRDRIKYRTCVQTESEVSVSKVGPIDLVAVDTHENLTDVGGESKDDVNIHLASNHKMRSGDLSMEGFLSRPVQVAALRLDLESNVDLSFNIWDLFLGDPTVRSKLRNYAFLRCDLNVRLAVSGTPFHYGRLLVSYVPYPNVNSTLPLAGPTFRPNRLRFLAQTPGAKTMDVRDNKPLEVHVPYVSPQPVGRLFNTSAIALADSTPYEDFHEIGRLYVNTLNQIKAVSTTATNVFLYIYVYASNVTLSGSTGTVIAVQTESDEREKGPVEKYSSSLVPIADALSTVPSISVFARASSMALRAMSSIASLFGWSYPNLIDKPVRMRPEPYQNGAQLIGVDTGKRITLDPKQELSVDPRIVGVTDDELVINSICAREGLLTTFDWEPTDIPLSSVLFDAAVTPLLGKPVTASGNFVVQPTPLAFAAAPFKFWRGKMHFRFEIVCSNFHRGKIMFLYEPNISQLGLIAANISTNKQYIKVIDIQETNCVEFVVDWNFPKPYARNIDYESIPNTTPVVVDPNMHHCANGFLLVTPFTELQSPDGSSIQINVFVRGSDMVFNRFSASNLPQWSNPYSSIEEKVAPERRSVVTESLMDKGLCDQTTFSLNLPIMPIDSVSHDFFGEIPISFRALLKRFAQSYRVTSTTLSGPDENTRSAVFEIFPTQEPFDNIHDDKSRSLYQYLRYAFLAQRGSLRRRVKILNSKSVSTDPYSNVYVSLMSDDVNTLVPEMVTYEDTPYLMTDGTVLFVQSTNAGIEFEVPNYTNNMFVWACNTDPWYAIPPFEVSALRNYKVELNNIGETQYTSFTELIAAGEDFSFFRWVGPFPYKCGTVE